MSESSCLCSSRALEQQTSLASEQGEEGPSEPPSPHSAIFSAGCYTGTKTMPKLGWYHPCRWVGGERGRALGEGKRGGMGSLCLPCRYLMTSSVCLRDSHALPTRSPSPSHSTRFACRRCRVWTAHTVSVVVAGEAEDVSVCKRYVCTPPFPCLPLLSSTGERIRTRTFACTSAVHSPSTALADSLAWAVTPLLLALPPSPSAPCVVLSQPAVAVC